MSNVTPLHVVAKPSVEYVQTGRGIAIVRGDKVTDVLTRDELAALAVPMAVALKG